MQSNAGVRGQAGWLKVLVAGVVGALVVAVPVAWASHLFSDVPNTNAHHDDIAAIALAGVTTGCGPGVYCPDAGVTRGQMASFLRRGLGRVALRATGLRNVAVTTNQLTIWDSFPIRPGLPSGSLANSAGFIKADSQITIRLANAAGCPCRVRGSLALEGDGPDKLMVGYLTNVTLSTAGEEKSLSITGAAPVMSSGTKRVQIRVWQDVGTGTIESYGNATALYVPFGSQGTNELDPAGAPAPTGPDAAR